MDQLGSDISAYLTLLRFGAICGILAFVVSLICLIMLAVVISRLPKRPPVQPMYAPPPSGQWRG